MKERSASTWWCATDACATRSITASWITTGAIRITAPTGTRSDMASRQNRSHSFEQLIRVSYTRRLHRHYLRWQPARGTDGRARIEHRADAADLQGVQSFRNGVRVATGRRIAHPACSHLHTR